MTYSRHGHTPDEPCNRYCFTDKTWTKERMLEFLGPDLKNNLHEFDNAQKCCVRGCVNAPTNQVLISFNEPQKYEIDCYARIIFKVCEKHFATLHRGSHTYFELRNSFARLIGWTELDMVDLKATPAR